VNFLRTELRSHHRDAVATWGPCNGYNLLKAVPGGLDGKKLGVENKRLLAGWHDGYLLRVLGSHHDDFDAIALPVTLRRPSLAKREPSRPVVAG